MGKQYKSLEQRDIDFIEKQQLFFMASSSGEEINLTPKGYDTLRVINNNTLVFASYPGSGNRTYRDAINNGEFTLLFTAFEGAPLLIKTYCNAHVIEKNNPKYEKYINMFTLRQSIIRNIFEFHIYAVESSCGMSVPVMEYKSQRNELKEWAIDMDRANELQAYNQKRFTPPNLKEL